MDIKDIRALSGEELKSQLFELRRRKAVGNLEHGEQIKVLRKDLAKAETVKRERELHADK